MHDAGQPCVCALGVHFACLSVMGNFLTQVLKNIKIEWYSYATLCNAY